MESSAIRAHETLKELNLSPETAKEMVEIIVNSKNESLSRWVVNGEDLVNVRIEHKEDMFKMENSREPKSPRHIILQPNGLSVLLFYYFMPFHLQRDSPDGQTQDQVNNSES
ncbi:MAG: hypothetical protein QG618_1555 [Thermodesulfobacteriota bacterium]|nr:hypothetical protein [Thermodesulfobacteriota bacterium]